MSSLKKPEGFEQNFDNNYKQASNDYVNVGVGNDTTKVLTRKIENKIKWPLKFKLISAILGIILLSIGAFSYFAVTDAFNNSKESKESLEKSEISAINRVGKATSESLAQSSASLLLDDDLALIQDAFRQTLKNNNDVIGVGLIKNNTFLLSEGFHNISNYKKPNKFNKTLGLNSKNSLGYISAITIGDQKLGEIYVELSTLKITQAINKIEKKAQSNKYNILKRTLILGALASLLAFILTSFISFTITKPLNELMKAANEIALGKLNTRAQRKTNDEVGVLCERFNNMTEQIGILVNETAEKASMEKELDLAKNIQISLMPERKSFQHMNLEYFGFCESAEKCGGDWWHHYILPEGKILLCIGDVTGHGVSSALLTASAKACCDTIVHQNKEFNLINFMQALDLVIQEAGKKEYVMTFFAAIYDPNTKEMTYANAGHNFPFIIRNAKPMGLVARGARLGDGSTTEQKHIQLEKDDLLVFYSDGIIECTNPQGEEFGMRKFRRYFKNNQNEDPEFLTNSILEKAYSFYDGEPPDDDITLLIGKII